MVKHKATEQYYAMKILDKQKVGVTYSGICGTKEFYLDQGLVTVAKPCCTTVLLLITFGYWQYMKSLAFSF